MIVQWNNALRHISTILPKLSVIKAWLEEVLSARCLKKIIGFVQYLHKALGPPLPENSCWGGAGAPGGEISARHLHMERINSELLSSSSFCLVELLIMLCAVISHDMYHFRGLLRVCSWEWTGSNWSLPKTCWIPRVKWVGYTLFILLSRDCVYIM